MKKMFWSLIAILGFNSANANTTENDSEYIQRSNNIKAAIDVLTAESILVETPNQQLNINQNLLQQLRQQGIIKKSPKAVAESICVVPES